MRTSKDAYDPTKPFNIQTKELIAATHPKDSFCGIRVTSCNKRFKIEMDGHWSGNTMMQCSDGIGTKGLLHWKMKTEEYGVRDAFAMVVNDLAESGHVPVFLQDHLLIQKEDNGRIFKIIGELADLATKYKWEIFGRQYPIAITGGETAIINTIKGFDLGITGFGYVAKGHEICKDIHEGDLIIGLGSNGCHSNGYTFLREEFFAKRKMHLNDQLPWGETVGEALTKPTEVYLQAINYLLHKNVYGVMDGDGAGCNLDYYGHDKIHGMVHITGGGLSKLKELNMGSKPLDILIRNDHTLKPQNIFEYIKHEFEVPTKKMYTRFNNGVGYVVAVDRDYVDNALTLLRKWSIVDVIGEVVKGKGRVLIASAYDGCLVEF